MIVNRFLHLFFTLLSGMILCLDLPSRVLGDTPGIERGYAIHAEGEGWYAMWHVPSRGPSDYLHYDIEPTLMYGVSLSGFYRTPGAAWFGIRADYLSNFQEDRVKCAFGEDALKTMEVLNGALLFNLGQSLHFSTRVLYGRFVGVLHTTEDSVWKTDWTLVDVLWVRPPDKGKTGRDYWYGFGVRMIGYEQPLEMLLYKDNKEVGREIDKINHRAYCLLFKWTDGSHFGISDVKKFWYADLGLGIGLAVDKAEKRREDLYGAEFAFDLDLGLKHVFPLGPFAIGGRLGYRVIGDLFVLAKWSSGDNGNTSTTAVNLFHGVFASVNACF